VDRSGTKPFGGVTFERLLALEATQHEPDACPLCKAGVPIDSPGSRRL